MIMKKIPIILFLVLFACAPLAARAAYDPLAVADSTPVRTIELMVVDVERNCEIPLLIYLPERQAPAPVILFSHGLGGSRYGNAHMGQHWAKRGYVAVFLQHAGSDDAIWQDKSKLERLIAMKRAASGKNLMLRAQDVHAVIDQLGAWNKLSSHPLLNRLEMQHLGMSGHSFGAMTTQAVSGQKLGRNLSFNDNRIAAAMAFSPSKPRKGMSSAEAFGDVSIPWMLMTGTNDDAPIGNADAKSRLEVYPALPAGGKYELVLDGAEHSAFTDRALPGDKLPRNPNHHRAILALSTAFWDAWLKGDTDARAWLDGATAQEILEPKDRFQKK
jgi:predicted dienelactone hydrolase